ncbi:MAG TPA: pantoate--beta-alanine ligase [Candidatus Gastranaerophilales bacterium]|nr:pantoate--beta-alanine ligase [Candidatus Gastranaerophilales bacterium]
MNNLKSENMLITEILYTITQIRQKIKSFKEKKLVIGLVPTMGALHIGHESLIKRAKQECDIVIVSIFVNPIQFCLGEDFEKYPRQIEADRQICSKLGVDIIFAPNADEMYPDEATRIDENFTIVAPPASYQNKLCGNFRKGHFNGVATVVLKLFNIITPDKAYFGRKDAQQLVIIKKMIKDIDLPLEIVDCPIIREPEGLACSSRNKYLSAESRNKALCIFKSLKNIEKLYNTGITSASEAIELSKKLIDPDLEIEYFEAFDFETLKRAEKIQKNTLFAIAVKINGVRLIDNLII